MGLLGLLAIGILSQTRLAPTVRNAAERKGGRPFAVLLREPDIIIPMLASSIIYALMVLVMVAAPLAMVFVCGHTTEAAAFAIQCTSSPCSPSFVTGSTRIGAEVTAAIGLLLIIVAAAIKSHGITALH
jgi:hypothetical protein